MSNFGERISRLGRWWGLWYGFERLAKVQRYLLARGFRLPRPDRGRWSVIMVDDGTDPIGHPGILSFVRDKDKSAT